MHGIPPLLMALFNFLFGKRMRFIPFTSHTTAIPLSLSTSRLAMLLYRLRDTEKRLHAFHRCGGKKFVLIHPIDCLQLTRF